VAKPKPITRVKQGIKMSKLEIYTTMANNLRTDIKSMEHETKTLDMEKHPYLLETIGRAKTELLECENQIEGLG
jgi:hypothetical protein